MRIIFIMMLMLLTGCAGIGGLAPSGVMDYSCEPNCKAKDYYIPGKGVWAKKKTMKKAEYGALGGSAIGAVIASRNGGDPLVVAAASVVGLVVGAVLLSPPTVSMFRRGSILFSLVIVSYQQFL